MTSSMSSRSESWTAAAAHSSSVEVLSFVQSVDRGEHGSPLATTIRARSGPSFESLDVRRGDSGAGAEVDVVIELVGAAPEVSDPQDHQLGLAAGELPAGHEPTREAKPSPEQRAVATERQEEVGRPGARHPAGHRADGVAQQPDVRAAAGCDAGHGRLGGHEACSGCGVVSSTFSSRAMRSTSATRRRTAWSTTR